MIGVRGLVRRSLAVAVRPELVGPVSSLTRHGVIPESVWRHLPVTVPVTLAVDGRRLELQLVDHDGVARQLMWRGNRSDEWPLIGAVLAGGARGIVVDVGANAGLLTAVAAIRAPLVIAFEPVPQSYDWTRANLARNRLSHKVDLRAQAVADHTGTTEFHIPLGDVPSSASLGTEGFRGADGSVVEVPVTTLDEALDGHSDIALIKIDVEGHEPAVLAGAEDTVERSRPNIIVESNHDGPWAEIDAWLERHHYMAHRLDHAMTPVTSVRSDPDEVFRNILCRPRR